jgi:hypothetical protein
LIIVLKCLGNLHDIGAGRLLKDRNLTANVGDLGLILLELFDRNYLA